MTCPGQVLSPDISMRVPINITLVFKPEVVFFGLERVDGLFIPTQHLGNNHYQVPTLEYDTVYLIYARCWVDPCKGPIEGFFGFITIEDPNQTPTPTITPTPTRSPTPSPSPSPTISPTPSPSCIPGAPTFVPITFGEVQDPLPTYHPGGTVTLTAMPLELADFPTTPSLATWTSNWGLLLRGEEITRTITFPNPGPDITEIRVGMTGPGNPCPAWSSDTAYYRAVRVTLTPTATPQPTPVPTFTPTPQPTPSPLPTPTVGGGDGWVVREVGLRAD